MNSIYIKTYLTCLIVPLILFSAHTISAQDVEMKKEEKVVQTFRDTRVINSHSVETLPARKLDFRVSHRFGDLAGSAGGWTTFYGLENASDIGMGLEYGLSDNLMIGVNRTKGAGPLKQLVNGMIKARIMNQEKNGNLPFSLSVVGITTYSTMQKSTSIAALNFFEKGSHRLSYHVGLHLARKFSEALSLQFNAAWTFRNNVPFGDQNDLPSIGGSARISITKAMALVLDSNVTLANTLRTNSDPLATDKYYPSLGVGFEFDTSGGHVFQINLTNSTGLTETDYIPYTTSNWGDGEFRLGFTISRLFSL